VLKNTSKDTNTRKQEWIDKVREEKGLQPRRPKHDEDAPRLNPYNGWMWEGFMYLSSQRKYNSAGIMPISMRDMEAYLNIINQDIKAYKTLFVGAVIEMDRVFREEMKPPSD